MKIVEFTRILEPTIILLIALLELKEMINMFHKAIYWLMSSIRFEVFPFEYCLDKYHHSKYVLFLVHILESHIIDNMQSLAHCLRAHQAIFYEDTSIQIHIVTKVSMLSFRYLFMDMLHKA